MNLFKGYCHYCDALQQNGTSRTCQFWDFCCFVWLFVCLFLFYFVLFCFFFIPWYVFYHLHVISDWFSNIFLQKIWHFLQPVKSKTIGTGNFEGWFLKSHLQRNCLQSYTNGHISKNRRRTNLIDFGIRFKAESVLLTLILKAHFTQNVSCSLFCGSASHFVCFLMLAQNCIYKLKWLLKVTKSLQCMSNYVFFVKWYLYAFIAVGLSK